MSFFRVPMHADSAGREAPYAFVIIEEEDIDSAYQRALSHLPHWFGDATDDGEYDMPPITAVDPLEEPWLVFTQAFFAREDAEALARQRAA